MASIVDGLPGDVLKRAGDAVAHVREAEQQARSAWNRHEACEPWTPGTAARARRLREAFAAMLEERGGRLARVARRQITPWHLDDEPLHGALVRLAVLIEQATEVCAVVVRTAELRRQIGELHTRFASDLPSGWHRWLTTAGLTGEALDVVLTLDELESMSARLQVAERRLEAWRADLERWITEQDNAFADRESPILESASTRNLEARYEVLLRLGAVDRGPMQQRSAIQLRSLVREHLEHAAAAAGALADDPAHALAADYTTARTTAEMAPDEIGAYREVLRHYYRLAVTHSADD